MRVLVCDKSKVHDVVNREGATHLISICDPGDSLPLTPILKEMNRLHLTFEDVLDENAFQAPTMEHVERILDFTKDLPDDAVVLVHCFAGVSRSTAAAAAVVAQNLLQKGFTDVAERAVAAVREVRPMLCPNPVISKFADDLLGLNGQLFDECEKVANEKILKLMS